MFKKNTVVISKKVGSAFRMFFNLDRVREQPQNPEETKETKQEEVKKSEERKVEKVASADRKSEQVVDEATVKQQERILKAA